MVHQVKGYYRRGRWVTAHPRRSPGRQGSSQPPSGHNSPRRGLAAAGVTIAVTAVGGTLAWTIGVGPTTAAPAVSSGGATGQTISKEASPDVKIDLRNAEATLVASGYKVNANLRYDRNCAQNSYGAVRNFFIAHPCKWLARASLTLRAGNNSAILVAISWVGMPSVSQAESYKKLVDGSHTGNVLELTRVSGPYTGVKFTGKFYDSGRDGLAVWNTQVQPVAQLPAQITFSILKKSEPSKT
jgi:hypothetical protein